MKKLIILLFLISNSLMAFDQYLLKGIVGQKDEGLFEVDASGSNVKRVILDCRSFIHGISFETNREKDFLYISEAQCIDFYILLSEASTDQSSYCLNVDFNLNDWFLESEFESCQ